MSLDVAISSDFIVPYISIILYYFLPSQITYLFTHLCLEQQTVAATTNTIYLKKGLIGFISKLIEAIAVKYNEI